MGKLNLKYSSFRDNIEVYGAEYMAEDVLSGDHEICFIIKFVL